MKLLAASRFWRRTLLFIALAGVGGCASAHGGAPSSSAPRAGASGRLDSTEFRKSQFRTIDDALRVLRPEWFQIRATIKSTDSRSASANPIIGVFIEGQARGYSLEKLTEYNVDQVHSARRILPSESMASYGTQWGWGGIVLTLVAGRR
jgi:hypothetical protein